MDWIKPGEVIAEIRKPKEGWAAGPLDLIKSICTQEGYRFFEAKILNSDEIAKLEIILPKDQVSTFQSWLDVRSIGVVFMTLEHY